MDPSKLTVVLAAAMLVMTAFASVPVAAEDPDPGLAVETDHATDVTDSSATLNGNLTALGNASNATTWFEYWVADDRENNSTTNEVQIDGSEAFSESVDGLEPNTTYVYVAHAATENESVEGDQVNFTTAASLDVETREATDVTNSSATLNGELMGMGDADSATVWFEYWVQDDRDNTSQLTQPGETLDETGSFNATVGDLEPNTTYVYVTHAKTGVDVDPGEADASGDEETFTTGEERAAGSPPDGVFGQQVVSYVKGLLEDPDRPIGQLIADFVTKNNPGADKRSDNANPGGNGPPDDAGPPDHAGPGGDDAEGEADDDGDGDGDQ